MWFSHPEVTTAQAVLDCTRTQLKIKALRPQSLLFNKTAVFRDSWILYSSFFLNLKDQRTAFGFSYGKILVTNMRGTGKRHDFINIFLKLLYCRSLQTSWNVLPGSLFPSQESGFLPPSKRGNSSGVGSKPFRAPEQWERQGTGVRRDIVFMKIMSPAQEMPFLPHPCVSVWKNIPLTSRSTSTSPPSTMVPSSGVLIWRVKSIIWPKIFRARKAISAPGSSALVPWGASSSEATTKNRIQMWLLDIIEAVSWSTHF